VRAQLEALLAKLDEQLALLRQATPLLRARAAALPDPVAAAVRRQLAAVLDQQTDLFEHSMKVCGCSACLCQAECRLWKQTQPAAHGMAAWLRNEREYDMQTQDFARPES
jgi:hypothetical protein